MDLARSHPGALSLGERHVVVFPPVDTDEFAPDPARRAEARAELGIPQDAVAVVSVGNRNPTKGFEWLVRAAERVRKVRPDVVFRVLGAPSPPHAAYEESVRREAAARGLGDPSDFEMLDAGTRVSELLPAFDAFALLSVPRSEGIPTVILEAMACGLPPVVTDVGAVVELVEDGVTGFVVPPEDDRAQAEALLRVVEDAELRVRIGAEGRRTAVESYGLESLADRHAQAFELALAHRRSRG
jgi:glycosyltransferase involved in cell wall biosynthesis